MCYTFSHCSNKLEYIVFNIRSVVSAETDLTLVNTQVVNVTLYLYQ